MKKNRYFQIQFNLDYQIQILTYNRQFCYIPEEIKNDDGEEKRDEEKSEDGLTKAESEEEEIEDEESKYITEEYDPVLVSVHQDSFIRFWTMEVKVFFKHIFLYSCNQSFHRTFLICQ